jgi:hypothetical protein
VVSRFVFPYVPFALSTVCRFLFILLVAAFQAAFVCKTFFLLTLGKLKFTNPAPRLSSFRHKPLNPKRPPAADKNLPGKWAGREPTPC